MANVLGDLVWRITGDNRNFDKSINDTDKKVNAFGKGLKKIAGLAAAAFSVGAIVNYSKRILNLSSDLNESQNAINVVFGDASNRLREFGETATSAIGLTQTEFNSLATSTGALLKQTGLGIGTVADQTIELSKRAADTASIFNVEVNESLSAFNALLRGESEPARRFGVNISDAAVQAEALASGLVKTKDEITDQIKVQARYNLLLQQTSDFSGDFQNTAGGFANQLRILRANIDQNSAVLGDGFLPIATVGISLLNDFTQQTASSAAAFRDFSQSIEGATLIGDILGNIAGTFALIGEIGKTEFGVISESVNTILEPLKELSVETEGTGLAFSILGGVLETSSIGLRIFAELTRGQIEAIINLGKAVFEVGDVVGGFFGLLSGDVSIDEFKQSISEVGDAFEVFGLGVITTGTNVANEIKTAFDSFGDNAEENAKRFEETFNNAANNVGGRVFQALTQAGKERKEGVKELNEEVIEETETTTERLQRLWDEFGKEVSANTGFYIDTIGGQFSDLFSSLGQISQNQNDAELQRIQSEIDAAEEGTEQKIALEEELDRKKRQFEREAAIRQKRIGTFNAVIDTASAIIGFLADPGGIPGVILSALAGITGAAQIAAINSTPVPQLATGGVISGGSPTAITGEGSNSELVAPLTDDFFDRMGQSISKYINFGDITLNGIGGNSQDRQVLTMDELRRRSRNGEKVIDVRGISGLRQ